MGVKSWLHVIGSYREERIRDHPEPVGARLLAKFEGFRIIGGQLRLERNRVGLQVLRVGLLLVLEKKEDYGECWRKVELL